MNGPHYIEHNKIFVTFTILLGGGLSIVVLAFDRYIMYIILSNLS